jgi:cbb3-type cytochrome oxidase maturation protein
MLVILALLLAGVFLASFIVALRRGQFDDLETPAQRMLFEDPAASKREDEK